MIVSETDPTPNRILRFDSAATPNTRSGFAVVQMPKDYAYGAPTSSLYEAALERVAREADRHRAGASAFDELRLSVRLLCVLARQESIQPEHLLVNLKRVLNDHLKTDAESIERRTSVESRIVTYAIESYYSDAASTKDGR